MLLILGFNFYNAFISESFNRLSLIAWGNFLAAPFIFTLLVWLILELINYFLNKKQNVLPSYFWGLITTGLILDSTSDYSGLYDKFFDLDKIFHFLIGGFFLGFLILKTIEIFYQKLYLPKLSEYFLVILLVNFIGVIYEFFEYIGQKYFGAGNIKNIFDTTEDLILNILGVLIAIFIHFLFSRKSKIYSA